MPELPEVETVARRLREGTDDAPSLLGRSVRAAALLWQRSLALPQEAELLARLPGQTVSAVGRRGKFILIHLAPDTLLVHLRMSGDLRVEPADAPVQPHDRFWLEFAPAADGVFRLAFNDPRKFGRIWLARDPFEVTAGLGPEPLDPQLDPGLFDVMLHARRRQLKPLLLDQSFLAGLGNIYADEALHLARLHPNTPSDALSPEQSARLLDAIRAVLSEGIRRNGASIDWVYRGGSFQNHFRVYQRTGAPCPVCGTPVVRITVGQRSTHFCPVCQPEYHPPG
jgi:formamidopyrimidine-DNA glycosylase